MFLYAATAIIDAVTGVYSINQFESYLFKVASAATILAAYVYLISREKTLRPIPFIATSLLLSVIAMTRGRIDTTVTANLALKIVAVILTLKPEAILIEITDEEEEENQDED